MPLQMQLLFALCIAKMNFTDTFAKVCTFTDLICLVTDQMCYSNSLIKCKNLTRAIMLFLEKGLCKVKNAHKKVKIYFNKYIDLKIYKKKFYQCELITAQIIKNIKNVRSHLSMAVFKIQHNNMQNIV